MNKDTRSDVQDCSPSRGVPRLEKTVLFEKWLSKTPRKMTTWDANFKPNHYFWVKSQKNIRLFQRFGENHSFYNENEVFPMFASRWLPDAASGRLAKPKAKTKTRTKTKAETKIEAKSKTRLRLSLRLGLRQRLRLKLRIVSNWNTCLGSSPRIIFETFSYFWWNKCVLETHLFF